MAITAGQDLTAALLTSMPIPLDTLVTNGVTNSNAETIIGTFANGIPAGDAVLYSGYRMRVTGTWDSTGTPTIRFRMYMASISAANKIIDSGSMTGSGTNTFQPYWIDAFLICTGTGSSGFMDCGGISSYNNQNTTNPIAWNITASTFNTTIANQIIVTAQYGTASTSNTARTISGILTRM